MRKIMVKLFLVMTLAFPVFVQAQDATEVPPDPTIEVFETPTALPTETSTPEPTVTPTPTPVPPPVEPGPVDGSLVVPQLLIIGIVALAAFVAIAWHGITAAAKGLPEWSRPILLSNLKSGIDTLDNLTDGAVADAGIAELRRKYAELEKELSEVKAQVNVNSSDIAITNRAVSQAISNR